MNIKENLIERQYEAQGYTQKNDAPYNAEQLWNRILEEKIPFDQIDEFLKKEFKEIEKFWSEEDED